VTAVRPEASTPDEPAAPQRILDAAARRIASQGSATLALSEVAADAGVSKALIHYHFHDKDALLARVADHVVAELVAREQRALAEFATQHSPLAVDALWRWLHGELRTGGIRVLLQLEDYGGPAVRAAARRAAALRREQAAITVERLFTILELRPRIAPPLLADVVVAFTDGLALDARAEREDEAPSARVAFDVFWLAMLSLAE